MKYEQTEAGRATLAMYAAAAKAGFREELARAQVEVFGHGKLLHIEWEVELQENEGFVIPREALRRAEAWLTKYKARAAS